MLMLAYCSALKRQATIRITGYTEQEVEFALMLFLEDQKIEVRKFWHPPFDSAKKHLKRQFRDALRKHDIREGRLFDNDGKPFKLNGKRVCYVQLEEPNARPDSATRSG